MAVFTVTASDATQGPRQSHVGEVIVSSHLGGAQLPASFSASDIVLIARIPNHATITDFYMSGIVPSDATVFDIGLSSDDDAIAVALTLSATAALQKFNAATMPVKVSFSDDVVPQYTYLIATRVSGTSTTTCSIQFVVKYAMPGAV
jgi:ABC-type microcin C transport system permease subunit YejB